MKRGYFFMRRGASSKPKHNVNDSRNVKNIKEELIKTEKIIKKEDNLIAQEAKAVVNEEKTLFQSVSTLKRHHQVLFSIIIITAVVLVWRGIWNLADRYWFPMLPDFSDISGLIIGIGILFIMRSAFNRLTGK